MPDSDGDGLSDARERELGTDPNSAHSDRDGLNDKREVEIGTDPTDPDTDGDRLPDGPEVREKWAGLSPAVPLPGADPLHKDLYVAYTTSNTVKRLNDHERGSLREIFGGMNVSNPDGEQGIDLHLVPAPGPDGVLNENIKVDSRDDFGTLGRSDAREQLVGNVSAPYTHVMLVYVDVSDGGLGGVGQSPGLFAVVDGRRTGGYGGRYSERVYIMTHELLHTLHGQREGVGEDGHSDTGWLHTAATRDEEHLDPDVAEVLSEKGFAGIY